MRSRKWHFGFSDYIATVRWQVLAISDGDCCIPNFPVHRILFTQPRGMDIFAYHPMEQEWKLLFLEMQDTYDLFKSHIIKDIN